MRPSRSKAFVAAAEAVGLGCCPISVIRNHAEEVGGLLGLPDHLFPVAGLGVGEPTIFVAAPAMLNAILYGNGPAHPLGPAEELQHLVRVMKRGALAPIQWGFVLHI